MKGIVRFVVAALLAALLVAPAGAQTCPAGVVATPKSSTLYLFFPTAVDSTFPSYEGEPTSPVNPFTMASHDPALDTAAVRQAAFELVQAGYCEFDIDVRLTTSVPSPAEARWQIVGIGSDNSSGDLVGLAQDVDTGDAAAQDYSRVWTENLESWTGAELTGANSTVNRWGRALANLIAHEAAHNYGGEHDESAPRPGEDPSSNHFEADPAAGATPSTIVDQLNHFSDTTYERFGHDVGLTIKTLHNWDFVNPNGTSADQLTITLLSSAPALTIGWFYTGSLSPWTNPTVTKQPGTITFRGTAYNVFDLVFSAPKAWSGGPDGVAPAGEKFHVGATFTQSDPVIVWETAVSAGGSELSLKPRMFGYDAGLTPAGGFGVSFFNTGTTDLELSDVEVFFLPRMVSIEEMVVGGELRGVFGNPITPYPRQPLRDDNIVHRLRQPIRVGREPFELPLALLTDRRHLDREIKERECEPASGFGVPRHQYCAKPGNVLSLFPATYVYVIATVTDPNAHYWDKTQGKFVDGPLSTKLFFQVAGEVPDANRNDVDDLVDIRNGTSRDDNGNGIPDEAEGGSSGGGSRGLAAFARIGAAFPDPGLSVAGGLEYLFTNQISAVATLGLDQTSDADLRRISLGGRYYFPSTTPFRPYGEAALGLHDSDGLGTEAAASVGVGLLWSLGGRLSLDAAYHRHLLDDGYSTVQAGLRWKL